MYACHINPSLFTYTPYRVGGDKVDLISLSYDHITFNLSLSPGFTVAFQGLPLIEIKRPTKLQRKTCSPIILCNFQFVMPMHNYSKCECRMQVNMYNLLVKNIFFFLKFQRVICSVSQVFFTKPVFQYMAINLLSQKREFTGRAGKIQVFTSYSCLK